MQVNPADAPTIVAAALASSLDHLDISAIAVGLSGGPDSWALALAAQDYCTQHHIKFIALTVDHRLRLDSTAEAASVAAECARRGMPHATLRWEHEGIESRKQERARAARYGLLGDYCAAHGFTHLLVAHHADDQAETVLLRFARASGAAGLASMAPSRPLNEKVTLLRPFLDLLKSALVDYAAAAGVPFVTDPGNDSAAFGRGRLRAARDVLAAEGLTTQTLLKAATAARDESDALHFAAGRLLLDHVHPVSQGLALPHDAWLAAPLALRMLAWQAIRRQLVDAAAYPPDRDSLRALCLALETPGIKRTLGGMISACRANKDSANLHFWPENDAKVIVS